MSAFTLAQQSAIVARGNVLIIAGAGTGKTRTLIERCLQLLRDGVSLDRLLLVTFTEAAAAEMRARLRKALQDELQQAPVGDADILAEQLALLDTAQISTLHSFCLRLVREHFHHLAIDPQLVILDEGQTRPLSRDCLTALLDEHYAGRHPHSAAVQQLIRRAGRGSDEHLRELVWRLHRYTQTLHDPEAWSAKQLSVFREEKPTPWRTWLYAEIDEWHKEWLPVLATAPDVPTLNLAGAALRAVTTARAGVLQGPTDSDGATTESRRHEVQLSVGLTAIRAADSTDNWARKKGKLRPPYEKFFEEAEFFLALLAPAPRVGDLQSPSIPARPPASPLAQDWGWCRHEMAALVQLAQQFTARFAEAKRQLGGVDFSDLEQFALRLLRDDATGVARHCRAHFTHVCVDEYQDINAAQDAILRLVSGEGASANRFLVGDLKQSIYRFRLASPHIFASYAKAWRVGDLQSPPPGVVIALSDNFRSREAILNFVNPLFRALMRESIGGVAYDAEAELKFGGTVPAAGPRAVELHLLTKDAEEPSDERDATTDLLDLLGMEREARCVALRLRALHAGGHEVWDEEAGAPRRVEWRDMVVLMRSPGSRVESFAQEFHRAGVPLHAARGGFYEALEVRDLLNLLRLLDNPLQDLPLLAVLRSPLVAMSLEELVALRAQNDERLFWNVLVKGARTAKSEVVPGTQLDTACTPEPPAAPLFTKATSFLARFTVWRERLRLSSLTDCLENVLAETHYESLLLAEPRGAERVANVRRLLDLARQFDPYQRQGLHRFLQFIAAQEEAELDHAPTPVPTDNAVRLMSIHQSKGLEFPVLVVAGLGTLFNERDLRGEILLDADFGLCPMVSPPDRERRYASLPHWLARRRGRRELLGEELRLLYVALTRARDTLLLVGTDAGKDVVQKWREPATALSDLALLKARCPLHWLRAWLPSVTAEEDWRGDTAGQNALLSWDFYTADDRRLAIADAAGPLTPTLSHAGGEGEAAVVARLRERLSWSYPHASATHELAKTSVTVLRRRAAEPEPEASTPFAPRFTVAPRSRGGLTATQVGLAHHAFLQCVDLARTATALDLRNEAARLTESGVLTERDAAALDFVGLLSFWESSVGQQIRAHSSRVQREVPFTARFAVSELAAMGLLPTGGHEGAFSLPRSRGEGGRRPDEGWGPPMPTHITPLPSSKEGSPSAEFVIVQGVADLVVFGEKEIWLLDYKTDHFDAAELSAKVREHGPQLSLYADALERIYGKKVTRTWLHFLALGRTELL